MFIILTFKWNKDVNIQSQRRLEEWKTKITNYMKEL